MTDWNRFFNPASIAVVGASEGTEKIGGKVLATLMRHNYPGKLFPVNPGKAEIAGLKAYPSISAIGMPVDQALLAIPAKFVPETVRECADCGVPAVVIFSSGFSDAGPEGARLQEELSQIVAETGIRISGPNAEGFFSVAENVAATFSPAINIEPGDSRRQDKIGIVSQSGGLGFAFYNRGRRDNLAFSQIVSVGNQVDLEIADYLEHFIEDDASRVIMMYVESFKTPQRFIKAARRAAEKEKPIVMVKVGASKAGQRAAESHTGAIASSNAVINAVLDHCGIIRADDQDRLLDCAAALANCPVPQGNRVAIVSASGGTAVWLADAVEAAGFEVPEIAPEHRKMMEEYIPSYGSTDNPVDITAQGVNGYARTLEILGEADYIDAIVVAATFSHEGRLINEGQRIAELSRSLGKPVLVYSYTIPSEGSRKRLQDLGLHCFTSLQGCVAGLKALHDYGRFLANRRDRLLPERDNRDIPDAAAEFLAGVKGTLCEYEAKQLLTAYGIPIAPEELVTNADAAVAAADRIGYPVVLKLQSPAIPHKTEAGVIRLGVTSADQVREAYQDVVSRGAAYAPSVQAPGVSVQKMAPKGTELIAGIVNDPDFGPMILTGLGGIFVEILEDVRLAPAPLSHAVAEEMLRGLKGAKILDGARGEAPRDIKAMADLLVKLSHLAWDSRAQLTEFDVNPVFLHEGGQGLSVVDALAVINGKEEHA